MNKAGRKGWAGERPVLDYLQSRGWWRAYRLRSQGTMDKGDIGGIDRVAIEVKNRGTYDFPGWMRETAREKANAGAEVAALVVKPRGVGATKVGQWWTMLTLEDFCGLLLRAGYGPLNERGISTDEQQPRAQSGD